MPEGLWAIVFTSVVGPALGVLLLWARDRRKDSAVADRDLAQGKAEAQKGEASLAGATLVWARELREELAGVKAEMAKMSVRLDESQDQNRRLAAHNHLLSSQVIGLGGVPIPMPE